MINTSKTSLVRTYEPRDYPELYQLYVKHGWFDDAVDAEEMLNRQIAKEPDSILVAVSEERIVGTVSLLATNRLALFFRLISEGQQADHTRSLLIKKGEEFFIQKGYRRLDVIAPENDFQRHREYLSKGFTKGNIYRWFYKRNNQR